MAWAFGATLSKHSDKAVIKRIDRADEKQDARHAELRALLIEKQKSLGDQLWNKFPFGYILFGGAKEGDRVALPFRKKGDVRFDATWEKTTFEVDATSGLLTVTIPDGHWESYQENRVKINVDQVVSTLPFKKNRETPLRHVFVSGQPRPFFELLDDDTTAPVFVIGFKE